MYVFSFDCALLVCVYERVCALSVCVCVCVSEYVLTMCATYLEFNIMTSGL